MTEQTQPTDAELIAELETAGVQFMAFRGGVCGTKDIWTTSGSQQAKQIAAGMRAAITKWGTPAGAGEVVAWLVPHLRTFKGATKVHFTRAPGCTMTDAELMDDLEGRVMWLPSTFSDSPGVTDKFGVHHKPKPLFTTPQPTQAQAGAVPLTVDEVEQLIAQWSYELHGDRARYLVRMTEQHHGIKGADHVS